MGYHVIKAVLGSKVLFVLLLSMSICNCITSQCIRDSRIIVKDSVFVDLAFFPTVNLSGSDFRHILSGASLKSLNIDEYRNNKMSFDYFKAIPMISTYKNDGMYTWEDFKGFALDNSDLFYLGNYTFNEVELHFVLIEWLSSITNNRDRALYIIVKGNSEQWVLPIAMSIMEGWHGQMVTTTSVEGDVFEYRDDSYAKTQCSFYIIESTGSIVIRPE